MSYSYVTVCKYVNNNKNKSAITSFVIGDQVQSTIKTKGWSIFKSIGSIKIVSGNRWLNRCRNFCQV